MSGVAGRGAGDGEKGDVEMSVWWKRVALFVWMVVGCLPMAYVWRWTDWAMRWVLMSDPSQPMPFGSAVTMTGCLYGYFAVIYMITKIEEK